MLDVVKAFVGIILLVFSRRKPSYGFQLPESRPDLLCTGDSGFLSLFNSFCASQHSLQHDHVYDIEDNEQQPHSYNEDTFDEEQEVCDGK